MITRGMTRFSIYRFFNASGLAPGAGAKLNDKVVRALLLEPDFPPAKWQQQVQNLRNCWPNCKLHFFGQLHEITSAIFACKSLIYIGFSRAWISVNQRFSGQNLRQGAT